MYQYNIRKDISILGSLTSTGDGIAQSALVTVDDEFDGLEVVLGTTTNLDRENEIFQKAAAIGDKISFDFIERLYLALKEDREKRNKGRYDE